jgi:hypothetical protein
MFEVMVRGEPGEVSAHAERALGAANLEAGG